MKVFMVATHDRGRFWKSIHKQQHQREAIQLISKCGGIQLLSDNQITK
jgi:predicted oxidoreductase